MAESLDITIKTSGDKKYELTVNEDSTIANLKQQVASVASVPAEQQRLIYSGRVLKDDQTVQFYKIKSGHTVHLVKGAKPASSGSGTPTAATPRAPTNIAAGQGTGNPLNDLTSARYAGLGANLPSASMFGPDGGMGPMPDTDQMLAMLETPEYAEAMQQLMADPETMMSVIGSTVPPEQAQQMRQMIQSPEFRNILSNPQAFRQLLRMSQQLRGFMGNDSAGGLGGLSGAGAGFPAPGNPDDASSNTNASDNSSGAAGAGAGAASENPFAALLGGGGFPMFGQNFGAAPAAPVDDRPPEERYESQLRQLNELGFYDFDRNVRALRRSGGNVQGAIEALLDGHV